MNPWHAAPRLAAIFLMFAAAHFGFAAQATTKRYETLLEEARAHAADESWALARDAYAAAVPLAPDAEATRWTTLGLTDATWRSEDTPRDWQAREKWIERKRKSLEALITGYTDAAQRDDYWVAVLKSRLAFEQKTNNARESVEILLTIADQLATRRADPVAIGTYLDFLFAHFSEPLERTYDFDPRARWLAHLDRGAELASNPEEHARFLIAAARQAVVIESIPIPDCAARWDRAVDGSRGTTVAPLADALKFVFIAGSGFDPGIAENQPVDFPKLIAEAKRLFTSMETMHLRYDDQATPLSSEVGAAAISLGQLERAWSAQYLTLEAPHELTPGEPLKVGFGAAGYSEIVITLLKQGPTAWARKLDRKRLAPQAGTFGAMISRDDAFAIRAGAESVVHTETVTLSDAEKLSWHTGEAQIATAVEPGFHMLLVDASGPSGNGTWMQDVMVSSAAATSVSVSANDTTIYFFTKTDGSPLARTPVTGIAIDDKESRAFQGITDADGAMKMKGRPKGSRWTSLRLVASVGNQPVDISFREHSDMTALVADVILDRPIYRPGETVNWKMVLRERKDGLFNVSRKPVWISVEDRRSEPILARTSVSPNEFGTAHGSFVIPESTRPGICQIGFYLKKDADRWKSLIREGFTVDNFVPPAITSTVELASPPESLQPGREIRVRVSSRYFSGGPVAGAPVTLGFEADLGWENRRAGKEPDQAIEEWIEALKKDTRAAETNANGTAEFSLSLPLTVPDDTTIEVLATVAPVGAQADQVSTRWLVNRTGLVVDPLNWTIARPIRPGESVEFVCNVKDGRGIPVAFSGVASLVELSWEEAWLNPDGEIVSGDTLAETRWKRSLGIDDEMLPGWKKLHSGYARSVVAKSPVSASNDQRVRATFQVPHAGLFQLELSRDGSAIPNYRGRMIDIPLSVFAADESTSALTIKPGTYLLGAPDYSPGKPLRLLSIVPDGFGPGVVVVSGENSYVTHKLELPKRVTWIEVKDPPGFAGGGTATLISLRGASMHDAEHSFTVGDPSSRLSVTVGPREDVSLPGKETEVHLRTLDSSGKPRRTEVLLGVADESVRQLVLEPEEQPVDPGFLRFRRVPYTTIAHSEQSSGRIGIVSLRDPRPGATRSRKDPQLDEDAIILSPFEVRSGSADGYYAVASIAGTRVMTEPPRVVPVDAFVQALPPPPPGGLGRPQTIITRRFFASTAAWMPEIVTDANGEARVTFKYPDNLTQWRFDAYAVGADGNTFGQASVLTRTSLPFQARLQTPRFLVEGDKADLGVLLLNRTDDSQSATASLAVEGAIAIDRKAPRSRDGVAVPKQGETRLTWPVRATEAGFAKITITARAGAEGDAMEIPLPVLPDGFWQDTAASARLGKDSKEQTLRLKLPDPLDPAKARVVLKLSPGHIPAMLDALPYLVDYPYGCVEQTMSRFLPALVVRKTLVDLGFDEEEVEGRIVAKESAADRARRKKTAGLLKIDEVAEKSLTKLSEAQNYNGGFGWWPGQQQIDPWMTAYVVWGLALARECDFDAPGRMEAKARISLIQWMGTEERASDTLAWALFAASRSELDAEIEEAVTQVFKRVMKERGKLGASGRACLALAAKRWGSKEEQAGLVRNLENGATRSQAAGYGETVHWGSASGYWRATDGAVECTALTLLALLELDPDHRLVEPAAVWLGLNRRSARWSNTRDTALAVLALSELVKRSGTLQTEAVIEVSARGMPAKRLTLDRDALLGDALGFDVPSGALRAGMNEFRVRFVSGSGPVYALGLASAWSRNEGAFAAGHLVGAVREFERMVPIQTVAGTVRFTSESLARDGSARQGEEVHAVVALDVPNELEYLAIEVPKPAGCEPLNPLSGWDARLVRLDDHTVADKEKDPGRAIYREEHDDRSVFFLDRAEAGRWEIRFGMRATFAGDYRAAPAKVEAMYAPEIRANTDARRVRIEPAAE